MTKLSALKQHQGRWVAKVDSPVLQRRFQADFLPVMTYFKEDPQWSWPSFHTDSTARPDRWWLSKGQDKWRELLTENKPLFVRHSDETDGTARKAGKAIGVFRIEDLIFDDDTLRFKLVERLSS